MAAQHPPGAGQADAAAQAGVTVASHTADFAASQVWDSAAAGWDAHTPLLAAWLQAATIDLLDAAAITPGARVLDIAAGAGDQTLDIARRVGAGGQVLATDISPAILALARAKFQRAGLGWVQTRVVDAQALDRLTATAGTGPGAGLAASLAPAQAPSLASAQAPPLAPPPATSVGPPLIPPFAPSAVPSLVAAFVPAFVPAFLPPLVPPFIPPFIPPFDAVVCRLGLMLCPQPQAVLTGALAALRPGGRFAALVFGAAQDNPCITTLVSTALRHAGLPPPAPAAPSPRGTLLSLGRPGLLADLLAAAGFAQVTVRSINAPMHLPSAQHYVDFVRTAGGPVMALLAFLSADAQRDAWLDIAQQLARFNTANGWVGPNTLLLGAGTRPLDAADPAPRQPSP